MTEHPDANHNADKTALSGFAQGSKVIVGVFVIFSHLDVMVRRVKTETLGKHKFKKLSVQLFVRLLLHSELVD